MNTILTVVICILIALAVDLYFLYRFGQKMQVRQAESQKAIETYSQKVSMLIIDKKRMKLKEAPFPPELYEKTPFYLRFTKVYVVKAKVGPRVANLMCDKRVFDEVPVKKTIQGKISGAYLTEITKGAVPTEKEIERRHKAKAKAEKKAAKEAAKEASKKK